MKIHPRVTIVNRARLSLADKIGTWHREHSDLTDGELLGILGGMLGDEINALAKAMIRAERHPDDPDKPGGVE